MTARPSSMTPSLSIQLDALRFGAALVVFLSHLATRQFGGFLSGFTAYGHAAVIVFFVLSGYVIAYVAAERERDPVQFVLGRATRIYSVALPALLLTALIDEWLIRHGVHGAPVLYQLREPWVYLPLFLSFATDWWFLAENAFSNLTYWSLSYEVWYYALFAFAMFSRGFFRVFICFVVLALTGPRVWLLAPIWFAGVGLYYLQRYVVLSQRMARLVCGFCALGLAVALGGGFSAALNDAFYAATSEGWREPLRYSQFFAGDYLEAIFVCGAVLVLPCTGFRFGRLEPAIKLGAQLSFALYLMHYPLLEFFAQWESGFALGAAVLICAAILGYGTERLRIVLRAGVAYGAALLPLAWRPTASWRLKSRG